MKKNYLILLFSVVIFSGCSVTNQVMGEYYLKEEKFNEGYKHFSKEISSKEAADISYYYYARFLLASAKPTESIIYFKKAIKLNPQESIYYSWMGVAYGTVKNYKKEEESYRKALLLDKENLEALIYLGHNSYDLKKYEKALSYYNRAIQVDYENEIALYNRAKTLTKLSRTPEALKAWKMFLEYYPSGYLAKKATLDLNKLDDFSYRNYSIGLVKITLKEITFTPITNTLTREARDSLDIIGFLLQKFQNISIHIVVYQSNNKKLAKHKALKIKEYLTNNFRKIDKNRLKLSWFEKAKRIHINNKSYKVLETVDFITIINK